MKDKPRLIVVAGPNGSGKTTITEKLLRHEWMGGCVYINPDVIAEQEFGGENLPEAFIKAANRAKEIREECLGSLTSMAFETVFSTPEKVEFVQRAKAAGFFIRLFFDGSLGEKYCRFTSPFSILKKSGTPSSPF
jgi:predicted ABC-type ATPase